VRRVLLAALALLAQPALAAFDVAALMKQLAQTQEVKAPFVERKFSAVLAVPIDSTGTLVYRRPDLVEKIVAKPRAERFRILKEEVVVERGGKEQRIALAAQPVLAAFAASLRGVLAGDAAVLQKYFKLKVSGDESAWTLELTPANDAVAGHVERITVAGRAGRVERIDTLEPTGDRTLLEVH
jgi:hypothetical protein